jgi:hypothetical protein
VHSNFQGYAGFTDAARTHHRDQPAILNAASDLFGIIGSTDE